MVKLYKIKFLKDTELKKAGDVVDCSKKSADDAVNAGYAEYIEETPQEAEDRPQKNTPEEARVFIINDFIKQFYHFDENNEFKLYGEFFCAMEERGIEKEEYEPFVEKFKNDLEKQKKKQERDEVFSDLKIKDNELNRRLEEISELEPVEQDEEINKLSSELDKGKGILKKQLSEISKRKKKKQSSAISNFGQEFKIENENKIIETSCFIDKENKIIIEQIYDEENGARFVVYNHNTKEWVIQKEYILNGRKYVPYTGEELRKKVVLLPTEPEEYGSDEQLDIEILTYLHKWVDIPEDFLQFTLWNSKRSWVYEIFHTVNYLRFQGDTGTGKTRGQDTAGHIHYKPIFTTGATTPAPLFRIIDKWRGTLVMDEADLKNSDESEEKIKIINQGFEKGKCIMRCDQNDAKKIDFFDPFCPKILGTRRSFEDKATESRCITHITRATSRKDIPLNLNEDFFKTATSIRNKLLMWRFRNFFEINVDLDYDFGDIEPRVKQIVLGYAALFGKNEKQMEVFKTYIDKYQKVLIEERQSSFDGAIVGAIHKLLEMKKIDISAQDIIEVGELVGYNGKQMQPRGLSSLLKSLGFSGTIVRKIDGKAKRCIPLEAQHLENLFKRYGYAVTVVTVVTQTLENNYNIIKEEKTQVESEGDTPRNVRNDRNSVTQEDLKQAGYSPQEIEDFQDLIQEVPDEADSLN